MSCSVCWRARAGEVVGEPVYKFAWRRSRVSHAKSDKRCGRDARVVRGAGEGQEKSRFLGDVEG